MRPPCTSLSICTRQGALGEAGSPAALLLAQSTFTNFDKDQGRVQLLLAWLPLQSLWEAPALSIHSGRRLLGGSEAAIPAHSPLSVSGGSSLTVTGRECQINAG